MSTQFYRITVVVAALSWLLLGMHLPAAHDMTFHALHDHAPPSWLVLGLTALFACLAAASLWQLLRSRAEHLSA
jgi:hypothetical protein